MKKLFLAVVLLAIMSGGCSILSDKDQMMVEDLVEIGTAIDTIIAESDNN